MRSSELFKRLFFLTFSPLIPVLYASTIFCEHQVIILSPALSGFQFFIEALSGPNNVGFAFQLKKFSLSTETLNFFS
jgi:hypothetical protein